jgi:phytoene desaturase
MDQVTLDRQAASASRTDPRPHAVVIGSGFGGLAAAIRIGARGYRVTVLERRAVAGGRAGVLRRDGFTFDLGPTIVTAPFLFEELWHLCGRHMADDVTLRPLDPFYCIRFDDGTTFRYCGDPVAMRAEVERFCPADVAGYERFMRLSDTTCRIGFERFGHMPFGSWIDMAKVIPDLLRLRLYRSVHATVARHISDPRLRAAFSFHPLLIGGNPFTTNAIYSLIPALERRWGVHFALGGTGRLVRGLVSLIEGQGGALRYGADVVEITASAGAGGQARATGVRLGSGEHVAADLVVSNADAAWTYRHLLPARLRRRWTDRRLARAHHSMGLFVWYFGTRRRYGDVAHHTILLGPRYRGLLDDIFRRKVLADDPSLYLHRPTATDPSLAPDGHDAFYVLSPVPNLGGDIDWKTQAEPYRQRIARRLSETALPDLDRNIVVSHLVTPLHFRDELCSLDGAAFAMEPRFMQSAWFRPHNRSEEVAGLYLVGAGTHPGAGVPGVLCSARVLDAVVPRAALV